MYSLTGLFFRETFYLPYEHAAIPMLWDWEGYQSILIKALLLKRSKDNYDMPQTFNFKFLVGSIKFSTLSMIGEKYNSWNNPKIDQVITNIKVF